MKNEIAPRRASPFLVWLATVLGVAVAVLYIVSTAAHAEWDNAAMNVQIDQTNFLVNDNCSATLIDKDKGLLLTASHCVEGQYTTVEREKIDDKGRVTTEKVRVATPGTVSQLFFKGTAETSRSVYMFKIVKSGSAENGVDLAVIQILAKLPNTAEAKLSCVEPDRGSEVYAVGNPRAVLYASVSKGIVSSINRNYRMLGLEHDDGLIQTTAAIGGGSSGGALYNENGQIIGVVVRGYQQISPLGLSVPLSDIKTFMKDDPATEKLTVCPGDAVVPPVDGPF